MFTEHRRWYCLREQKKKTKCSCRAWECSAALLPKKKEWEKRRKTKRTNRRSKKTKRMLRKNLGWAQIKKRDLSTGRPWNIFQVFISPVFFFITFSWLANKHLPTTRTRFQFSRNLFQLEIEQQQQKWSKYSPKNYFVWNEQTKKR